MRPDFTDGHFKLGAPLCRGGGIPAALAAGIHLPEARRDLALSLAASGDAGAALARIWRN